jgi:alkylhydroperoxidase/carboxymuconolactone decarboxylase family protein YurZ
MARNQSLDRRPSACRQYVAPFIRQRTVKVTDPELIEVFDNFAFDEVIAHGKLDTKTRVMLILATSSSCRLGVCEGNRLPARLRGLVVSCAASVCGLRHAGRIGIHGSL